MAVNTLDDVAYAAARAQRFRLRKASVGTAAGRVVSLWRSVGSPGMATAPPTGAGEAPTSATLGAVPFTNPGAGEATYLGRAAVASSQTGQLLIYDRLVHTSGLSGTDTTAQAVNTVALTRYTTGAGVEAWLEVYTQLGGTARTATVTYTNEAGTAGRTGTASIPATLAAGGMVPVSLQAGDKGVRSVQSVQLDGTTGAVGDFGVTLLALLAELSCPIVAAGAVAEAISLGLPVVADNACIAFAWLATATVTGEVLGSVALYQK